MPDLIRVLWCSLFHRKHHSKGTAHTRWMCSRCGIIALKEASDA